MQSLVYIIFEKICCETSTTSLYRLFIRVTKLVRGDLKFGVVDLWRTS